MRPKTHTCVRCGKDGAVWRGPLCKSCEEATAGQEMYALLFEDRSGIHSLHPSRKLATEAMAKDAIATGFSRLMLRTVTGQAGARAQLNVDDDKDGWSRRDQAISAAEFERGTS